MRPQKISKRQVTIDVRRALLEGVDLMCSDAAGIIAPEIASAFDAEFAHRLVTERFNLWVACVNTSDVAYDRERTFQWSRTFAMGTRTRTITDHSEFNSLISQGPDPDQYIFVRTHTVVNADFSNPFSPVLDITFDRTAGVTCIYGDCHSSTVDP